MAAPESEMVELETIATASATTSITIKKSKNKKKQKKKSMKGKVKVKTAQKTMMKNSGTSSSSTKKKKSKFPKKKNKNKKNKKDSSSSKLLPFSDIVLGSTIEGHVRAFTSFGIFIKTAYGFKSKGSNVYALLHKSQISDEPVEDMTKLFRIGAKIKGLRVINVDHTKGEVGLSLRKRRQQRKNMSDIQVGNDIDGTVSRVTSYGAFVDVGAEVNALVHISRISQKKIRNIRQYVNEGDKVSIRILSKDNKKKTMAASMLDEEADEYLNKRMKQMEKMKNSRVDVDSLKSELEYLEDAVRELELVFKKDS